MAAGNVGFPLSQAHQCLAAAFFTGNQGDAPRTKTRFQQPYCRVAAQHDQCRRINLIRIERLHGHVPVFGSVGHQALSGDHGVASVSRAGQRPG